VTLSFRPPEGSNPSKGLVYIIKYRKVGSYRWRSTSEFTGLRQTVRGLSANTRYELTVVARYRGESEKVESSSVVAETKGGKCALLNFPWMSLIYRMHSALSAFVS